MSTPHNKVFISWSGSTALRVAEALNSWMKQVNHYLNPWFSKEMERGVRWMNDISTALEGTSCGIVCVTMESRASPWIHFEAGALAKYVETSRVCPCLFRMTPADLEGPLAHFNATDLSNEEQVFNLMTTLNGASEARIEPERLRISFEKWWPDLQTALVAIPSHPPPKQDPRPDDLLRQVLDGVRRIERDLATHDHGTAMGPTTSARRVQAGGHAVMAGGAAVTSGSTLEDSPEPPAT